MQLPEPPSRAARHHSAIVGARTRVLTWTIAALGVLNRAARKVGLVRRGVLVIPPAAPGSMGDEAMVVATIEALHARGTKRLGLIRYRNGENFPVRVDAVFDLSRYFTNGGARGDEIRLLARLLTYRSVALLGADVLDGYYSDDAVRLRLRLVQLAALAGARTCILGFSWNTAPGAGAIRSLQELPTSIRLMARDSLSQRRLAADTGKFAERTADTAFLLAPDVADRRGAAMETWVQEAHRRGNRVLGVNISAVAMEAMGLSVEASLELARATLFRLAVIAPGTALLLIPHDVRGENSDIRLLQRLAAKLRDYPAEIRTLEPPLSARLIKRICGSLDAVWTGRMHLAIAALGQGTPAIAHEYQDKFSGLFSDLGIESMLVAPAPATDAIELAAKLADALERGTEIRATINQRLPRLLGLARRNVEALFD